MQSDPRSSFSRRQFLGTTLGSGALFGAGLEFLSRLPSVSAAEAQLPASLVKIDSGVEPTVRLLENTSRDRLLEEVGQRVKQGLSYRELLAALLLAGVRNVQPRPQVGFKFHAVLVINSAHLASLASPDSDRWLPIFWALDRFKSAQMETQKSNGWRMSGVDEAKVPAPDKARAAFTRAMDDWDEPAADAAAAALARYVGRNDCFELFARYGARDFRDIGHKAIYVANSFRTLECIGWHHAEPVLRSLAYALLKYDGEKPSTTDASPDRPWKMNLERLKKIRPDWQTGKPSEEATAGLLSTFRGSSDQQACDAIVDAINGGLSPDSIWNALLSASGELVMRKVGIVSLHAVTSSNALRFAHETCASDQTRLMLMLQNAAFVSLFRQAAGIQDKADAVRVNDFAAAENNPADAAEAVAGIFADAGKDRLSSARKALAYLDGDGDARLLMNAARRLVFLKGNDPHDYKFSAAVLEDYAHISTRLRNRYLASSLFYLPGSGAADNALVARTRAALS